MARIKKFAPEQNLSSFQTFVVDANPNSDYFRITEFKDTFTGGKNGFLIEGSQYLKESTEIKIEILDVAGNPIYYEPGNGIPEYYEGISKLIAVYIYEDTPIGLGKITILGELKEYEDNGVVRQIPSEWQGAYNVKWERTFQINKKLSNEDRVRFYRRPKVVIDEIVKPIFSGNPPSITQTGSLNGIPLVPGQNVNLTNFSLPTSYRLVIASGSNWTGSVEGQTITFDNINYSPTIDEVVNKTEIVVSPPYAENGLVKSFTDETYSVTFPYIEGVGDLATALTGSFAKINITDMKTFVGDAARVKVFRRSQSQLTDYEFVQEIQLESNELLRDITTFAKNEELYGQFTEQILNEYWVTSSNDISIELNQDFLYNSVKLNSSPSNYFHTSQSFNIQSGVEYTLDLNVRKSQNISNDYLKVFLSGSYNGTSVSQTITQINSSNGILQKTNFTENIIADNIQTASLYFEVSGSDWYINNVSLKASQETSFSPDEITFIQQVPKTLVAETFDYRFEFYDINNNYIPVIVEKTKTFVGGNTNLFNKSISITPDNLYFSFDSASNPANAVPPLVINFDVDTVLVTGSITYTSGAYDFFGNLIPSESYVGGQYPGYLTDWNIDNGRQPFLRVQDFTGSRDDIVVQFIRYTGEVEGVSDTFVITRVEDGKGGVSFEIVPFRGTQIKNKESKTLEVQAIRVDGINRIQLRDGLTRGWSEAKLHLLSSSLDGTQTYVSLSQAITNPNFIEGVSAGLTGSGEIDYNAIFNRDSIDNELTLYLMDGPTSESILTSIILTDLKDGLNPGLVSSTAEQFNIKYEPRKLSPFTPQQSIVTASFQRRGTTLNPLSASLVIYPSASIEPKTELPHFYMFYETGAFDDTISLVVTDYLGNIIDSGIPGGIVPYYEAVETKQLNLEFTYTEPITSASVTANKSFFITPDGLPGQNAIIIDIDPQPVALGSNHKGDVYNYSLANTDIQITQGDLFLINTASGDPGTFTTRSITPTNIQFTTLDGDSSTTMSLGGFASMTALSASIKYDFDIYPYFTASLVTASRTQKFTKVVEGAGAIEVTLDPIAVAFNADESGFISNYSAASTEVFIKQNDEFLIYDETNAGTPGTFLTASISASGITFNEISSSQRDGLLSGDEILHFKGFGGIERNQPSASITYNFKVYPYSLKAGVAGVPTIVSKTQTFSKVNDGSKARKVSLRASANTIVYDGDGVKVAPIGDVVLTATAFNTTGSAYFKFLNEDDSVLQVSSLNNTVTLPSLPGAGTGSSFRVELRDGSPNGILFDNDSVTISAISEGTTPYSIVLSNPASSVTVEVDGTTYFDNSGTLIRGYKGATELQFVEFYDTEAVDPITFLPIGTFGQFSASIYEMSSFLTQGTLRDGKAIVSSSGELYASASAVANWNLPQDNTQGYITYKIDFENGRGTQYVQQSFSTVFEGATGPGLVVRGEWDETIPYVFDLNQKRRDAVFREISGDVHYWATTQDLIEKSEYTEESDGLGNDDGIYTLEPTVPTPPEGEGYVDPTTGWQYLGQQDFFVAAKLAIFEESFVKNTINVGIPPEGNQNANIAIVGGTDEPYIAIGQTGTQGFRQPGVFIGMTNDFGSSGTAGTTGIMSLKSTPVGSPPTYNSMEWDGDTLTIRGAIRQTAAGVIEPSLRGTWASGTTYYPQDLVQYLGETWSSDTQHTSTNDTNVSTGVPGSGPWTIAAGAGKGVSLLADSYVIAYDAAGSNPTPSGTMTLIASSSNFVNGFYKFTGGGAVFTDETSFTDGLTANTDTATFTIPTSYFSTPLTFRVAVAEGDQVEKISDTITITAVQPGADSTPMYFITPVAGGTQLKNSGGTIELQVQKSDSTGLTNLASGDIKIYSGSTAITSISGVTGTDYNPTISAAAINGTMYLRLWDTSTVYDTITLLDVTDGLGGGSFISPNLKSTRNPATNNYTPSFLSLTASFYDVTGSEHTKAVKITPNYDSGTDYMYYDNNGGEHSDSEITLTLDNGDGVAFSGTGIGNKLATKDVVVTANFTDSVSGQTLSMVETVYIISDGADGLDAINVVLSNSAHTLAADSSGTVTSYAGSGTTISVYEGINQLNHDGTGTANGTFKVVAVPTNITVGSITDDGDDALVGNHSSMTDVSASIQYQITGSRVSGSLFTSQVVQTLTKAVAGTAGINAKTIRLSADSQTFRIAQDGTVTPSTITFTANRQNLTNTTTFTTNPSPLTIGTPATDVATLTYNNFSQGGTHQSVTITATADGLSDEITVVEIVEGTNGITILNSNQSHTVPASSAGVVSSFAGSGTKIEVYEGATKLDYDGGLPPSDGAFSIGNVVITPTDDFDIDSTPDEGADYIEYGDGTAMDNATDVVTIRYGITGSRANGEEFRADTFQTIAKSKAGENGSSGTSGADGAAGEASGIVYAGSWDGVGNYYTAIPYLAEDQLKYVVKDGSTYYICKLTHRYRGTWNSIRSYDVDDVVLEGSDYWSITTPVAPGGGAPSTDPGEYDALPGNSVATSNTNLWESFGAQFTSVATDILFAEDVYANKTINIGTKGGSPVIALNADSSSGYTNPYIAIGQESPNIGFNQQGIYFGYSGGNPVLSLVSGSTYMLYESGSITLSDSNFFGSGSQLIGPSLKVGRNTAYSLTSSLAYNMSVDTNGFLFAQDADIRGTINALDGTIGDWEITDTQISSVNSNIVLDADEESITVFNTSGDVKFSANTDNDLPSIQGGASKTVTVPTTTFDTQSLNGSPSGESSTSDLTLLVGGSSTFTVSSEGKYTGTFSYTDTYTRAYAQGIASCNLSVRLIITSGSNVIAYGNSHNMGADGDVEETGGGYGGFTSVVGNTEILLADGTTKFAKDVTTNDKILSWDEINQSFVEASISTIKTSTKQHYKRIHLEDRIIEVTTNHEFWYDDGVKVSSSELQSGDFIYAKIFVCDYSSLSTVSTLIKKDRKSVV